MVDIIIMLTWDS